MSFLGTRLKSIFNGLGYELTRKKKRSDLPDDLPDRDCYSTEVDRALLYQPWLEPGFRKLIRPEISANTMLNPWKLYILKSLVEQCLHLPGDIFEAGTASGGSALLILDIARASGVRKHLWTLDTFEGYQGVDPNRDGRHVKDGDLRCAGEAEVTRLLVGPGDDVTVVAGRIPATLAKVKSNTLAFAHIDVNLAEPTYEATRFCIERMTPGGIVLFDDYGWPLTYGARLAIDKAVVEMNQRVIAIPASTQAFLIRT